MALVEIEQEMLEVQMALPADMDVQRNRELQQEYTSMLLQIEEYWAQRSRVRWALLGDMNTSFFHASVVQRRRLNQISSIKLEDGSTGSALHQNLLSGILTPGRRITVTEVACMSAQPSDVEIVQTVFSLNPNKAAGPDGVNGRLIQAYWDYFGPCITQEVKQFFITAQLDPNVAVSNTVLIPKVDHPATVSDYRPISVCNFLYKVISKLLANRMKSVIGKLILPNQTAFTPGRDKSENIIMLREVMHSFRKRSFNQHAFAFKCDLSKAFDRMEWNFVESVLVSYGFLGDYIQWISSCITSAQFRILFSGRADGFIKPTRGLRQGCTMSPYLFILAMDVLWRMLELDEANGGFQGVKLAANAPSLTSLMFADDLIIFGHAFIQQVMRLQQILRVFCDMSGQRIGHEKSRIWFSSSTPLDVRRCIMEMLNATAGDDEHIYLGVPVTATRSAHFKRLVDKVQAKLNSWSSKLLSQAGKIVLIKSVIEPMVLYGAAGGSLPETIVQKINQLVRNFFWQNGEKNKMHLINWSIITKPKGCGGLGLRDVSVINNAAMMKILWKLASGEYEDSLWARILKAKYLARKLLWMATVPSSCTKLWRAIMGMREILKEHITWQLANGDKCQVFGQPWHEFWLEFKPTNRYDRALVVSDLIDTESQTWNSQKLIHALGFYGALFIACNTPVPPCNSNHTNRLIFKASQNGKFSYKAAVRLLQGELVPLDGQASGVIKLIWHTPDLLPRIRIFLWKMFHNSIPTQGLYARRLGKPQPSCPLCNNDDDDASHALFKCPAARAFWLAFNIGLHSLALPSNLSQVLSIIGLGY
ncbi:RNA-directed DNA polymerase (reverse transcriptase)-related family protein [Rhynchospora pubera]|uniref:RNA-directed DNA polymerase (Reverse transcriptase)-related family protein n=1 Tax=Rhynchospora pubera TaxID=906938 RepID=A0AAV8CQW9_9POAL|nr:RNA-directed DNA polymerase (reverse transcriptase)-related family protein [Rhynchospora pubera]